MWRAWRAWRVGVTYLFDADVGEAVHFQPPSSYANSFESAESGGYRDFQIILKTSGGWLVEVQVIPEEMLELKKTLGHKNYTHFRFLREANERAQKMGLKSGTEKELVESYRAYSELIEDSN